MTDKGLQSESEQKNRQPDRLFDDPQESVASLVTLKGPFINGIQQSTGKDSAAHPDDFSLFMHPQAQMQVDHNDIDFQMCFSNRLGKPNQTSNEECAVEISTVSLTSPFDVNESIIEKASSQKKPDFDSAIRQLHQFDDEETQNVPMFAKPPEIRKISFENEEPPPRRRDAEEKVERATGPQEDFSAENFEQVLNQSRQRNCKSSSRVKKSIQDAQGFPRTLSAQVSSGMPIQKHQIPLTAGRHGQMTAAVAAKQTQSSNQSKDQYSQNQMKMKFQLNLKGLNSTSGGSTYSASYSNKDLSERLQLAHQSSNQVAGNPPFAFTKGDTVASSKHTFPRTNDPYAYLHARQQKHKSSRSAHPNHQAYLLQHQSQNNSRTLRAKRGQSGPRVTNAIEISSSYSNSSQRATPVTCLADVKNPSLLISFRFVNRKVPELNDIHLFRNLTELDVSGNLLQQEVTALKDLQFLKKLNLAHNQIEEMWRLPQTLEILNISNNSLKKMEPDLMRQLSNLTTLEISNNGLESLEGMEYLTRLKRLIAKNNQIQELESLKPLSCLIEIDLENNPIDDGSEVIALIKDKKDILVMNLKNSLLMVKVATYEEFIEQMHMLGEPDKHIENIKLLLTYFQNGVLYRNKKVFIKVRQQMSMASKRSSNLSQGSSSQGKNGSQTASFSPLLNLAASNSGNNPHRRDDRLASTVSGSHFNKANSTDMGSHINNNYEAIEILYDKILEEEDKLLLQQKKKEMRMKRERRRQNRLKKLNGESYVEESFAVDESKDITISANDSQDELEDLSDSQSSGDDLELQSYDNQEESPNKNYLNESTADFNKQIKEINQELQREGQLNNIDNSHRDNDTHDIDVVVKEIDSQQQSHKKLPMFKLDLSKCHTSQTDLSKSPEKNDLAEVGQADQSLVKQLVDDENEKEDSSRVQADTGNSKDMIQMHTEPDANQSKKKPPIATAINQKQIFIPRLALQNLQRQTSEVQSSLPPTSTGAADAVPKSLKVLSSKRGKEAAKVQESQLLVKLESYERLIQDIKNALGEAVMENSAIVERILSLKRSQQTAVDELLSNNQKYEQQVENLHSQIEQLKDLQQSQELELEQPTQTPQQDVRQKEMGFSLRLADINKVIKMDEEVQLIKTGRSKLSSRIKSSGRIKPVVVSEATQSIAVKSNARGPTQIKQLLSHEIAKKIIETPVERQERKVSTDIHAFDSLQTISDTHMSPLKDLQSPDTAVNLGLDPTSAEKDATITSNYFDKAKEKIMSALKKGQVISNKRTNSMIETNRCTNGPVDLEEIQGEQLKSDSHNRMKIHDYVMVEQQIDKNKTYRSNNFHPNLETSSRLDRNDSVGSSQGYNTTSSATQKVGVYLEKMRERNSSLQERLSHSLKTAGPADQSQHAITQRPSTSLYARMRSGTEMRHFEKSKVKMLQPCKTPNQLSLHVIHKSQSGEDSIHTGREDLEAKLVPQAGKHARCRNERRILANHVQEGSTINYSDFLYHSSTVKHNTTSSQPLITVDQPHIVFEEQMVPMKPYQKVLKQLQATTSRGNGTQNASGDFADLKAAHYSTLMNKQKGEENLFNNRENSSEFVNQRGRVLKSKKAAANNLIGSTSKPNTNQILKAARSLKTDRANYSTNVLTGRSHSRGMGRVVRPQQAPAKKQKVVTNNKQEV